MAKWLAFALVLSSCSSSSSSGSSDLGMTDDLAMSLGADLAGADLVSAPQPDLAGADLAGGGGLTTPRFYGGTSSEDSPHVLVDSSGAIYIAANSLSNDGDLTGKGLGAADVWVLKLDPQGNILWNRTYGGSNIDRPLEMVFAADGDLLVLGETASTNGNVSQAYGGLDAFLVRLNPANGDVRYWQSIGGTYDDSANAIKETADTFTIFGYAKSHVSGNIIADPGSGFQFGLVGQYVFGVSPPPSPNPQAFGWGGDGVTQARGWFGNTIVYTSDAADEDLSGTTPRGQIDVVLDTNGTKVRLGGNQPDLVKQVLPGGEFVGSTSSAAAGGGEVTCAHSDGSSDIWFGKLSTAGLDKSVCVGGTDVDSGLNMTKLADGRYVVVGTGNSTDGDFAGLGANTGAVVIVLDAMMTVQKISFLPEPPSAYIQSMAVAAAPDGTVVIVNPAPPSSASLNDLMVRRISP